MTKRSRFWLAGLVLGALPLHLAHAETSAPAAQIVNSAAIPFSAASTSTRLLQPVLLGQSVKAENVKVMLKSVLFDKSPDAVIKARFVVEPNLLGDDRLTPALDITIKEIDKLLPGEYQLTLQLVGADGKEVIPPLTLTLERRAAQLQAPGKQLVELVAARPFATNDTTVAVPSDFRLPQADDKHGAAIFSTRLFQTPFTDRDGLQHEASLEAKTTSAAANAALMIALAPNHFPIGTLSGKLEVHGPDLKAPLVFDVEVRTRLLPCWIVFTVAIGLVFGYLLRVVLQRRLDLVQAQGNGLAALKQVQRQVLPIADAVFHAAVDGKLADLGRALLGSDPALMKGLSDAAKTAVDQAVAGLSTRLTTAKAQLLALRKIDVGQGRLPASMQDAVSTVQTPCDRAAERLTLQDAAGASAILDASAQALTSTLQAESARWIAHLPRVNAQALEVWELLDAARSAAPGIAAGQPFDNVPTALTPSHNFSDLAATAQWLDAWRAHGVSRLATLPDWVDYLKTDTQALADRALALRPAGCTALKTEQQALFDSAEALAQQINDTVAAGEPYALPPMGCRNWQQAARGLLQALLALRTDVSADAKTAFEQALHDSKYYAALNGLPAAQAPPVRLGAPGASALPDISPSSWLQSAQVLAQPGTRSLVPDVDGPGLVVDPQLLALWQARNRRASARLVFGQTLLVALVLLVASYALFGKGFVGTPLELAALFFWGFSADLTVASLASRVTDWAAKPKV